MTGGGPACGGMSPAATSSPTGAPAPSSRSWPWWPNTTSWPSASRSPAAAQRSPGRQGAFRLRAAAGVAAAAFGADRQGSGRAGSQDPTRPGRPCPRRRSRGSRLVRLKGILCWDRESAACFQLTIRFVVDTERTNPWGPDQRRDANAVSERLQRCYGQPPPGDDGYFADAADASAPAPTPGRPAELRAGGAGRGRPGRGLGRGAVPPGQQQTPRPRRRRRPSASVLLPSSAVPAAEQRRHRRRADVQSIVNKVTPGVVDINTTLGFANAGPPVPACVGATGLVLTNNHVIAGETEISGSTSATARPTTPRSSATTRTTTSR